MSLAKAKVGVSRFHYAVLTSDTAAGAVYDTPKPITGLVDATISPNSQSTTFYADNGAYLVDTALGELKVEINLADVPLSDQAVLLGHSISGGVMTSNVEDVAPDVAIGWEGLNSNGSKRFVWLFKGKFNELTDPYKTKGEKTEFQSQAATFTAMQRVYDKNWKKVADADEPDYTADIGTNWFTSVNGAVDTTPPTVTVAPLTGATAVAVDGNVVWTFSDAIRAATVTAGNFIVALSSTGAAVAGSLTLGTNGTVVTFNPTSNLAALSEYTAIVSTGVTDLAGNALAAPKITTFTTA